MRRRDVLLVGGLLTLAGCQSILEGDGATNTDSDGEVTEPKSSSTGDTPPENSESTESDSEPPSRTVAYREWVLDPDPGEELDGHGFFATAWPTQLPGPQSGLLGTDTGIAPDALVMVPSGGAGMTVAPGTVDRDIARETIEAGDPRQLEPYGGYDVYLRTAGQESEVVAMDDSGALFSTAANAKTAVEGIRTLVDATRGETSLYYETSKDFATLVDLLGTGTRVAGRTVGEQTRLPQEMAGLVAAGDKFEIRGETTELVTVAVFESSNAPGLASIETDQSTSLDGLPFVEQSITEIDGRTSTSRSTVSTAAIGAFLDRTME